MTIAELSVRRPVTVTMVYILICVVACVFIPRLGIALYPTTELPVLSVMTTYSGVGPEEIDENVTQVIENAIKGVLSTIKSEPHMRFHIASAFYEIELLSGVRVNEIYDRLNNMEVINEHQMRKVEREKDALINAYNNLTK